MGRRTSKRVFYHHLQGGKCAYCFNSMTLTLGKLNTTTIDHIIPRSQGGPSTAWNLVAACYDCNMRKADKPLAVFIADNLIKPKPKLTLVKDNVIPFPMKD